MKTKTNGVEAVEIGLEDKARQEIARRLNGLLADEFVLYVKARNFHWNVTGPDFKELHAFFEEQYEKLDEVVDVVAERARTLGVHARGSLKAYIAQTRLKESGEALGQKEMLETLLADHEAISRKLREDVEFAAEARDHGTADLLTEILEAHEKYAWMTRAYLA